MDKFDEVIKQAKPAYDTNPNFVDSTMQKIVTKPEKTRHLKLWVSMSTATVAALLFIFLVILSTGHSNKLEPINKSSSLSSNSSSSQANQPIAASSDDASLAADIISINSSINQENNDQVGANSAINDSSQQIIVPTD
jgi:hypothetical protein